MLHSLDCSWAQHFWDFFLATLAKALWTPKLKTRSKLKKFKPWCSWQSWQRFAIRPGGNPNVCDDQARMSSRNWVLHPSVEGMLFAVLCQVASIQNINKANSSEQQLFFKKSTSWTSCPPEIWPASNELFWDHHCKPLARQHVNELVELRSWHAVGSFFGAWPPGHRRATPPVTLHSTLHAWALTFLLFAWL